MGLSGRDVEVSIGGKRLEGVESVRVERVEPIPPPPPTTPVPVTPPPAMPDIYDVGAPGTSLRERETEPPPAEPRRPPPRAVRLSPLMTMAAIAAMLASGPNGR